MEEVLNPGIRPTSALEAAGKPPKLGEWLIRRGWLNAEHLQLALAAQQQSRMPLGIVLTHRFDLSPRTLMQALARQQGRALVAPARDGDALPLLQPEWVAEYQRHQILPLRWDAAKATLTAATPEPSFAGEAWLQSRWRAARRIEWHLCTRRDWQEALARHASGELARDAAERVWALSPSLSARRLLPEGWRRRGLLWLGGLLGLICILAAPARALWSLWALWQALAAFSLLFKAWLIRRGWRYRPAVARIHGWRERAWRALPAAELPVYSVLVPLRQEAAMVPHLLDRLARLDYPREKLDIKCLVEADDRETLAALKAARPEGCVEILVVPPGAPRTKPRACNYALPYLRGSLVTIYDAEDAPDPDQLRMSAWAFSRLPPEVACLQASLNFYNPHQSLITRWFALEYGLWFGLLLRGLERGGLPIPLGGTSNHLRRRALEQTGGWDAYNVTEDADLGMRLQRFGWQTRLLPSHTWEEAPIRLRDWQLQRRRWIKGYLQTWFVHLRMPREERQQFGGRNLVGFHLFIGAPCLLHLAMPPMLGLFILSFALPHLLPPLLVHLGFGCFLFATLLHFAVGVLVARRLAHVSPYARCAPERLVTAAALFPVYWLLHGWAAFRACLQLIHAPHQWDKTKHGHSLPARLPGARRTVTATAAAHAAAPALPPRRAFPLPAGFLSGLRRWRGGWPGRRKRLTAPDAAFIEANLHPSPGAPRPDDQRPKDPHHESAQLAEIRQEA